MLYTEVRPAAAGYIDWAILNFLAKQPRMGEVIHRYLKYPAELFHFRHEEATRAYYGMVASFMEEGWTSQHRCHRLLPDVAEVTDLHYFGCIMNSLVGGYRYEQEQARKIGTNWLGAGKWPTRLDTAAFLFFRAMSFR